MTSVVAEPSTQGYTNFVNAFFGSLPTDGTKYRTEVTKILPSTSVTDQTRNFSFIFNKLDYPFCYELHQTVASVKVKIYKKEGSTLTLPAEGTTVGGINSMVSSLFSSVNLKINDKLVSLNSDNHFLTSYLQTVLTYSTEVKNQGWLSASGFYMDSTLDPKFLKTITAPGMVDRSEFFRKNHKTSTYTEEGAHLMGKLNHEFATCEKSIPPGVRIQIDIQMNSDKLWIHDTTVGGPDNVEYKYEITDFCLYVPVSTLSERVCEDLKRRWEKEPITYHYRRFAINRWNIPKSNDCFSHSFFAGENPTRVWMCIAKSDDLEPGNFKTTPYYFGRKWVLPAAAVSFPLEKPSWLDDFIRDQQLVPLSEIIKQPSQIAKPANRRGGRARNSRGTRGGRGRGLVGSLVGRLFNQEADEVSIDADVEDAQEAVEEVQSVRPSRTSGASTQSIAGSSVGSVQSGQSNPRRNLSDPDPQYIYLTKCQLQLNTNDLGILCCLYLLIFIFLFNFAFNFAFNLIHFCISKIAKK